MASYVLNGKLINIFELAKLHRVTPYYISKTLRAKNIQDGDDVTGVTFTKLTIRYKFRGKWLTVSQLAKELKVSVPHIRRRLKKFGVLPGDDVTTVNFEKTSRYNLYRLNGKLVNLGFLAEKNHVSVNFLRMKFKALDVVPGDDISGLELSDKYAGKIVYRFKYHGRDINLQEIAQKFDIKVTLARKKIHRMGITNGADITHIDFSPERKRNKFILNGNVVTVKDLAALLDVTTAVIYAKIKKHNILPGDDVTEFFNSKTF